MYSDVTNKHNALLNSILNNKNKLISTLKTTIDENICDITFAIEVVIDDHIIDLLIVTNNGDIIICEIKALSKKADIRTARSQLIDYRNAIKKLSYFELLDLLKNSSQELCDFLVNNNIDADVLRERFRNLNSDYHTICILSNITNHYLKYYQDSFRNFSNTLVILLESDILPILKFNTTKITIDNKNIEAELKIMQENFWTMAKRNYFDLFTDTLRELCSKINLLEALITDTKYHTEYISNNLNNNISKTTIKLEFENSNAYVNNMTASEEIEKIRSMLIDEYKANSPIKTREFIKLIGNNPLFPSWSKMHAYFGTTSLQKIFKDGGLDINLNKYKAYDNQTVEIKKMDILNKIKKIYNDNNNVITESLLKENRLHPNTIKYYFNDIYDAYKLAGVTPKYNKPIHIEKSEFVDHFCKLIPLFSKDNIPFTSKNLDIHGIKYYHVKKYYGSLPNLLKSFNIPK